MELDETDEADSCSLHAKLRQYELRVLPVPVTWRPQPHLSPPSTQVTEERRRAAAEARELQKLIVKVYGEEKVTMGSSAQRADVGFGRKKTLPTQPPVVFTLKDQSASKIRFRDGLYPLLPSRDVASPHSGPTGSVVSNKGEKVIVEKNPADDYDGGSRGKVRDCFLHCLLRMIRHDGASCASTTSR